MMSERIGGTSGQQDPRQVLDDLTRLVDVKTPGPDGGPAAAQRGSDPDVDDPAFLANVHQGTREADEPAHGTDRDEGFLARGRDDIPEASGGDRGREAATDAGGEAGSSSGGDAPATPAPNPPQPRADVRDRGSMAPDDDIGGRPPERHDRSDFGADDGGPLTAGHRSGGPGGFSPRSSTVEQRSSPQQTTANHAPSVVATAASMPEDGSLLITQDMLLAGATDSDGDALTATNLSTPRGSLTDNGDGTWTYVPDADWNGTLDLGYEVFDGTARVDNTLTLTVTEAGELLVGTPGDDRLRGDGCDDTLVGGAGNDQLRGGAGNDRLFIDGSDIVIDGGEGWDRATATGGDDILDFANGATLTGIERVEGGSGDDTIVTSTGGGGVLYHGGGGTDAVTLVLTPDQVAALSADDIAAINDYVASPAGETLTVPDLFSATDFESAAVAIAREGEVVVLDQPLSHDLVAETALPQPTVLHGPGLVLGTDGADMMIGTSNTEGQGGEEIFFGGDGDDTLVGNGNEDRLLGGAGDDSLTGGEGHDILIGGGGDDTAAGGTEGDVYVFRRGDGNDHFSGDAGADVIVLTGADGGAPDPSEWTLEISQGTATWHGDHVSLSGDAQGEVKFTDGSGVSFASVETIGWGDSYAIDAGKGRIRVADADADHTNGTGTEDALLGGGGGDTLAGGGNEDLLMGEGGDDSLSGGDQDDMLLGGAGDDTLDGGAGADVLSGDLGLGGMNDDGVRVTVSFVSEDAGYRSTYGWYDTETGEAHILAANVDTRTNPDIEGFTATVYLADDQLDHLGFFVIPNGYAENDDPGEPLAGGDATALDLEVFSDGGDWAIRDTGSGHVFTGSGAPAYFTEAARNPGGLDHVDEAGSLADTGEVIQNWEDLPDLGDQDFNDLVFKVAVTPESAESAGGDDVLLGGAGNDTLMGGGGDDSLDGGNDDDRLEGDDGDDTLSGGAGDDTLDGGAGDDLAEGGQGDDLFTFGAGDGTDRFVGGDGWTDTIRMEGFTGGPDDGAGWTLQVDGGVGYAETENGLEFDGEASGVIQTVDGGELTFQGVERIEY